MIGTIPKIVTSLIPIGRRRPGTKMVPTTLTIHNTANLESSAMDEKSWLVNPANKVIASWHYAVDEKQAVQVIPNDEIAWHAGTKSGNYTSLSIEVCESGNQQIVWANAVGLTAFILKQYGWGTDRLRKHQDWSGKYCPRKIIPVWDKFVSDVKETMNSMSEKIISTGSTTETVNVRSGPGTMYGVIETLTPGTSVNIYEEINDWARIGSGRWCAKTYIKTNAPTIVPQKQWEDIDGMVYLHQNGLLTDLEGWKAKKNMPAEVWMVTTLLANIHKSLNK